MTEPVVLQWCFAVSEHGPLCEVAAMEAYKLEIEAEDQMRIDTCRDLSPRSCQFCDDGGCLGNPWCHCRYGVSYGQIFAEARAAKRKALRHSERPRRRP